MIYVKYIGVIVLGVFVFSDEDFKYNIIILFYFEYNDIGFRGVCWNWNESVKKFFGLIGVGCGVIV